MEILHSKYSIEPIIKKTPINDIWRPNYHLRKKKSHSKCESWIVHASLDSRNVVVVYIYKILGDKFLIKAGII